MKIVFFIFIVFNSFCQIDPLLDSFFTNKRDEWTDRRIKSTQMNKAVAVLFAYNSTIYKYTWISTGITGTGILTASTWTRLASHSKQIRLNKMIRRRRRVRIIRGHEIIYFD